MNTIIGDMGKSKKFVELIKQIENTKSPIGISGLTGVGMAQTLTAINEYSKKPIAIITYNEIQAKEIINNMQMFTDKVIIFTKKDIVTYDYIAESKDIPYSRIETINRLKAKKNNILVTTIEAVMQNLPAKETLYKNILKFKIGDICNLEDIKKALVNLGYLRCDLIEGRGQFSIRGGILDISINETIGVRIEFWGDEIDSIRNFNITSQRSINTLDKIEIMPAHEYILEKSIEEICKNIRKTITNNKQEEIIEEDIEQIKAGNYISKIDKYYDCFYSNQQTIIDYLSDNYIIAIDEVNKLEQRAKNILIDNDNLIKNLIEKEKFVPQAILGIKPYSEIKTKLESTKKNLIYMEKQDTQINRQVEKYKMQYREINYYKSEIENLFDDIKKGIKEEKNIYVVVSNKEKAKKLQEILEKQDIISKIEEKLDKTIIVKSKEKTVTITIGNLTHGFENYDINQIVISADDLIEGGKKRRTYTILKLGKKIQPHNSSSIEYLVYYISFRT